MTPIGAVSAASDSIVEHVNRRSYPFAVLPVQKFQTFTTPIIGLTSPFVKFAQGGTIESNKLYEAAIEQSDATQFIPLPLGPSPFNPASSLNYKTAFDCLIATIIGTPGALGDNTGFIGIELFTQGQAPLVNNPGNGCIQLKWQLKDPTQWMLSVYLGNSVPGIHRNFTVPSAQSVGGHKVRLLWDPYEMTTSAYVDDVFKVKQSIAGFAYNLADTTAGILLMNGSNLGSSPGINAYWMGATLTTYDLHTSGAGAF